MARLINADALLESEIRRCGRIPTIGTGYINEKNFKSILAEAPTVDAAPVAHGRWVWTETGEEDYEQYWVCSKCGEHTYFITDYCSKCGAKMDLEVNDA